MKAKRKVRLSGKWWYPTREFEFFTEKSIGEVIGIIKDQDNTGWLSTGTFVKVNRNNTDGVQEFSIRTVEGRGITSFIEGKLQNHPTGTTIHGKAGMADLLILGFLIGSFPALIVGLVLYGLSALLIGIIPLMSLVMYSFMVNTYKSRFYMFVDAVNRPKN